MIIGMDEAGRGPVFGPMVVCAAALTHGSEEDLIRIGARDSKELTPARREQINKQLSEYITWEVRSISANEIDRRSGTMNQLEVEVFASVLDALLDRVGNAVVYADAADVNEDRFSRQIQAHLSHTGIKIISKHKGDSIYPIVSAASIVAKVERDRQIRLIERELREKLDMPLGSGYPSDPITRRFLDEYVRRFGKVPPHTRTSWKTIDKIIKKYGPDKKQKPTTLFDFARGG